MNYKKIVLSIAFLAVFGLLIVPTGPAVEAMTDVETQTLIAQLQQQIAQLMAQIEQLQGTITTTAWCHTFNANIGMGQKTGNPEIDALKKVLRKEGLYDSTNAVFSDDSGDSKGYDETLASAVTGFQEKYASEILTPYNLKHGTGFVGKATRVKLNALYGCKIKPKSCAEEYLPVCGKNGKTYSNKCLAKNAGVEVDYEGKCITPTNKPPITPYVKIISPNGGETYKIGDSITVNWKTAEVSSSHKISLIRLRAYPNGQEYNLTYGVLNDGEEIITIPSSVLAGAYTLEIKTYADNILVFDASDSYFKIAETTPSITCTGQNASNFDYYTKGTVSWITASGVTGSMTDFCSNDNVLVKYYCEPTSGYNYKNKEYVCPNGCSNGACNKQSSASVTLNYVKIDGSNLKVSYNKNFDTCVHLLDTNNKMSHVQNWFCQKGDNIEISASLSDFSVINGQQIKLCHGNNYGICSNHVAISTACKYAVLDDNRDGAVTRVEGEEVIRRVQAIIGSRLGDANFVADYDTKDDGIISSLDSLRLINDLNICAPSAPTALAPNANDQLSSISDAIARMVEVIKEMLKK